MSNGNAEDGDRALKDDAARAAWLYYVGGLRQDRIAEEMGISRQRAQRLVARAMQDGLIRVRIDHPIGACLDLERQLVRRFGLKLARVAPSLGGQGDALKALTPVAAAEIERIFRAPDPAVIGLGTGRTLRAVVENMQSVEGSHHKVVSLIGNVAPDGSASFYEVVMRFADCTGATHFPMSVPVMARDSDELSLYRSLPHVRSSRALAETAGTVIVGIGQMGDDAPLFMDGFITAEELASLRAAGAAGEICGHVFDEQGRYLEHHVNGMLVGVRVRSEGVNTICIAGGRSKIKALKAAVHGGLISALITDEVSAQQLLDA
ncbi:sugar-binding transcriptional regulator [Pseudooceanicola algae]|uniref:Erythritol catabolism regulatory protein EryD n=1 Tax=Pseudooceanicola algae TaxID=1537215 RepID=A0A418SDQ5_9RHOB|nr:sugar-binding transcriptional regulator [Pseudooceanicola algae]QPM89474.1 Erythritol catabolism regulatory protein EryD [Pseudooceanicola algae]